MSASTRGNALDRVLVDINTQCDFLLPNGAVPVANRTQVLPNIRKLMNWARIADVPVVSSLESHRPGEFTNGLPPHCIDRSHGQRKLPFTLMPRRIILHGDNTLDLPLDPFRRYQQLIFTKRKIDFLSNPKADRLVNAVSVGHYIVFGSLAEQCVKAAVLGLLTRQHRTVVVTDACGHWGGSEADLAFRQMEAKGAVLVGAEELLTGAAEAKIRAAQVIAVMETNEAAVHDSGGNGGNGGNGKKHPPLEISTIQQAAKPGGNGKHLQPLSDLIQQHLHVRKVRGAPRIPRTHRGWA